MSKVPVRFDDFVPMVVLGSETETVSGDQIDAWMKVYPWDTPPDGEVSTGLATVLMMRAYLSIVSPRPPGNLHIQQTMEIKAPIRQGEAVTTSISCQSKEMRGERRMVQLRATGVGSEARPLFEGIITLYWAA